MEKQEAINYLNNLQKDYGQESQVVITFPLLVGLDGKEKMSKSLNNYIGLSDESFEKLKKSMQIPDEVLRQYFILATDLSEAEIDKIMNGDIRNAHFEFAKELLRMYDDINEFEQLKEKYLSIASGQIPGNIEEYKINKNTINICDLLLEIGFANSKSEAKRMIQGNGVRINTKVISDINLIINLKEEIVIQFGKNKFKKIVNYSLS